MRDRIPCPVCETHHHLVHEGGWNLTMTPDRTVTWTRPDGTIWITHHPSTDNPTNNDNDNEIGCLTPATPHHTLPSARARGSPSVPYRR